MAEMAIPLGPIPNRRTFMASVTDRFRYLWKRAIQVAKKAGNWMLNLTPVRWAWKKAQWLAAKTWGIAKPAALWGQRYVVKPAAQAAAVTLTFLFGTKLIALLSGLGLLGLIAVVIWVNRRNKVKAIEVETTSATGGPDGPEKRERRRKVTERITEVIEDVTDVLDKHAEEIKEEVAAERAADEAEIAEVEAVPEVIVAARGNGTYKVRLPEGDLDPNETLTQRFHVLDELINAELNKAQPDPEYLCELQARQNLIHVRAGKHSKVKKDATPAQIHRDFKNSLQEAWEKEHPGEIYDPKVAGHYKSALDMGCRAESARVRKIAVLKAEHDRLKKGKAA
jgi:hypothetical protein